jgi:hypothetical protein
MIALTRRRLHISIMIILRARTMLSLAPILPFAVHILASRRARTARTNARARRDLDVLRSAVVVVAVVAAGRWWRCGHGCGRGLDEDGDGLGRGDGEGFGRWDGDVGC